MVSLFFPRWSKTGTDFQFELTSPSISAVGLPVEGSPVGAGSDFCYSDGVGSPKITHESSVRAKSEAEGLGIAIEQPETNEDKGPFPREQEGVEPQIDFKLRDPRDELTAPYSETLHQEEKEGQFLQSACLERLKNVIKLPMRLAKGNVILI